MIDHLFDFDSDDTDDDALPPGVICMAAERGYGPWTYSYRRGAIDWDRIVRFLQTELTTGSLSSIKPVTLRQAFYVLVAAGLLPKTEKIYDKLSEFVTRARRGGIIDWDDLTEDKSRSQTVLWYDDLTGAADTAAAIMSRQFFLDRQRDQPRRLALLVETTGMLGQIARVAATYGVECFSGSGQPPIPMIRDMVLRLKDQCIGGGNQSALVGFLTDFDPGGLRIFETVSEDLEAFGQAEGIQIDSFRIALTQAQVAAFGLQTQPTKPTDAQHEKFAAQSGDVSTQLEAMLPSDLAQLVRDALDARLDLNLLQSVKDDESVQRAALGVLGDELRESARNTMQALNETEN